MRIDSPLHSPLHSPLPGARRRADGATLVCLFALALLLIPARLVLRGLPMSLTLADVLALLLLLVWLLAQFTTTLGAAKGANPVRTAIFAYGMAFLTCYGFASLGYLPSDELNLADHSLVLFAGYVGLVLVMCDGVRGRDRLDFVLKTVVVAGAIVSVVAACQYLLEFDPTTYMSLPGFRHTSVEGTETVMSRADLRRVAATLGHPIEFGVFCSMVLPFAAHFALQARDRGEPWRRWWLCAALIAAGLMFSVSRSAVLGMVVVGAVLFTGWPLRRCLVSLGALAVFLGLMKVAAPGLLGTFYNLFANAGSDDSILYRTHDYPFALTEVTKHPLFGRGIGTWYPYKHQVFDNQYLLSLVETGVVGVVAFVGVIVCGVVVALRARRLSGDPNVRNLALTIAACLLVPLVGAATFDLLSYPGVTSLMFLLIGAAGALLRALKAENAAAAPAPPAAAVPAGAGLRPEAVAQLGPGPG
ncbi:O-antigen ligase family protein [Microbispora sp. H13382]|uniref:O-antigen ligase family protein n=1 Tax=Microbispora sp. H13382 TaxID=2729112 RepID=UPI002872F843|nr:O-antigen ligase family protein [Microbispora sp. H13382]